MGRLIAEVFVLRIYIAGRTPAAGRAVFNLYDICDGIKDGPGFDIQVVDIVQDPRAAEEEKILATPVVIRKSPPPVLRLVGDLSDREQVIASLGLTVIRENG